MPCVARFCPLLFSTYYSEHTSRGGMDTWSSGRMGTSRCTSPFLYSCCSSCLSRSATRQPPGLQPSWQAFSSSGLKALNSCSPARIRKDHNQDNKSNDKFITVRMTMIIIRTHVAITEELFLLVSHAAAANSSLPLHVSLLAAVLGCFNCLCLCKNCPACSTAANTYKASVDQSCTRAFKMLCKVDNLMHCICCAI